MVFPARIGKTSAPWLLHANTRSSAATAPQIGRLH
jgi:hypothetical protein